MFIPTAARAPRSSARSPQRSVPGWLCPARSPTGSPRRHQIGIGHDLCRRQPQDCKLQQDKGTGRAQTDVNKTDPDDGLWRPIRGDRSRHASAISATAPATSTQRWSAQLARFGTHHRRIARGPHSRRNRLSALADLKADRGLKICAKITAPRRDIKASACGVVIWHSFPAKDAAHGDVSVKTAAALTGSAVFNP